MRARAVLVLVLALGAAGCLQGGEPISADDGALEPTAVDANETPTGENATDDRPTSNGTDTPANDTTTASNATGETETNTTGDPGADEEVPELPGNLTMDEAGVLERTGEQVRFRWEGSIGPDTAQAGLDARTTFDVPAGIPLAMNATLTWPNASDLDLFVDGEHVEAYCSSTTQADPGLDGGTEACSVRTFARSAWDTWGVRVDGRTFGEDAPPRPANFTVHLTIEVADPWTGPPVEVPQATDLAASPGWPTIEDAGIRPGVKVGVAGSGVNAGTGNFVFSSPDNRTLYLGWVAHGVDGLEPGDAVELPTAGVEATLVYCSWGLIEETVTCPELERAEHPLRRNDFALLRLPADARSTVHPATPLWGGPTGVGQPPATGDRLLGFGNTPYRDGGRQAVNALDAFSGLATKSDRIQTEAYILPQPLPGDSGSPAMTADGQATGVVVGIGTPVDGTVAEPSVEPKDGSTILTNLANAVAVMENGTALDVELKTWPLFDTPRAEDLAGPLAGPEP